MSDIQTALRETARKLLEEGTVTCVIGWGETRFPDKTIPLFVKRPEDAGKLVWNEHCVSGLAKYMLDYRYPEGKLAICVRGCDSRAVNRIVEDKQYNREDLYLIGLPCEGKDAPICATCAHRNPVTYDVLLGELVEEIEVPAAERFKSVTELEGLTSEEQYDYWQKQFSKCIHCYACRNACPACNCTECYADQYRVGWQGKQIDKAENQVYGLTRAFHVGDRCIECGECERVCPMGLPIMSQTRKILKDINALWGSYECGLPTSRPHILGEFDLSDRDDFM